MTLRVSWLAAKVAKAKVAAKVPCRERIGGGTFLSGANMMMMTIVSLQCVS